MNTRNRHTARWATSAFGDPPFPSPAELSALKTQLDECRRASGRLFSMQCMLEALNGILANRMVTMFVVVILFLCAVSLVY
jgi:hypothetical protein